MIARSRRSRVQIVPFQSEKEIVATITQSLFVVHPTNWYENLPNAIIEAFSVGKPVLSTRILCGRNNGIALNRAAWLLAQE
jgi:glycosyltransferase involved in cell wall biosynthesis